MLCFKGLDQECTDQRFDQRRSGSRYAMTFLFETFRLGLTNLYLHQMRSLLTTLGIIFGVFAVIMMIAIGEGNKQAALAKIRQLGARNIIVRSIKPPASESAMAVNQRMLVYGLRGMDLRRLTGTEGLRRQIERIAPLKEVGAEVVRGSYKAPAAVYGTTPDLVLVTSLRVDRGRYLSTDDDKDRRNVAVIGWEVAKRLFPLDDPIGLNITIGNQPFKVVGVLRPVGLAGGAGSALVGRDLNFDVHLPMKTVESRWGHEIFKRGAGTFDVTRVELGAIYIQAKDSSDVLNLGEQIRRIIELDHKRQADVEVIVPLELLEQEKSTRLMQDALLISIACISLLVGGIGIMNIMLASVTERTREIGIRRAVGATQKHIVLQFLVETTVLSGLGGLMGVGLGVGGAAVLGHFQHLISGIEQPQVTSWSIVVSFVVATSVGIVFGLYPAIKAAQQDPIVALRHD
jgi:putative ABC transport system permease protein